MPDENSVLNGAITSDERIRNVLRRYIRAGLDNNEFTRASLSQLTKVNIHQIDAILTRDAGKHRRVAAEDMLCLSYAIGEDCVQAIIGLIRYTAQPADEANTVNPNLIVATVLPHVTTIAKAAADGRIDHIERPACQQAADQIIATMLPLSSAGAEA